MQNNYDVSSGVLTTVPFYVCSLLVTSRVFCDAGYYGDRCNVRCMPRDDNSGHYTCDPETGNTVCMEGEWKNSSCLFDKKKKQRNFQLNGY